jgi:hypothetical protein
VPFCGLQRCLLQSIACLEMLLAPPTCALLCHTVAVGRPQAAAALRAPPRPAPAAAAARQARQACAPAAQCTGLRACCAVVACVVCTCAGARRGGAATLPHTRVLLRIPTNFVLSLDDFAPQILSCSIEISIAIAIAI